MMMKDLYDEVKPIFKQVGMDDWTDIKAGKDENGDMRVMARSKKDTESEESNAYEHGPWTVWKYLPESSLAVLNYPRYGLSFEEAERLFYYGY